MACTNFYNGNAIVLKVNVSDSAGTDLKAVGGQTGLTRSSNSDFIDLSNKDSGAVVCGVPGRITKTMTLDALAPTSDDGRDALQDAHDNRTSITVAVYKDAVEQESTTAYVMSFDQNDPDNDKSTYTTNLQIIAAWS